MTEIRRNILQVYLRPILIILFTFSIGIFGIIIFLETLKVENEPQNYKFFISFGACFLFILVGIYELYNRLKKVPKIRFSKTEIQVNKKKYSIDKIKRINLTGKYFFQYNRYRIKEFMFKEGMEIELENEIILHFFDEYYENLNELKLLLQEKFQENNKRPNINFKNIEFRNNQFLKLRGITTWGIIFYLLTKNLFLSENINNNGIIFVLIVCLLIWFWQSKFMYYFNFQNNQLTIKNENFFWVKKSININNIREIVIEKDAMLFEILKRKHLRIILNNHKQYKFGADLFTKKIWNNLKKELLDVDLEIRDERQNNYVQHHI